MKLSFGQQACCAVGYSTLPIFALLYSYSR